MKRDKIVRKLSDVRGDLGLSHVQIDMIANVLVGEPMGEPWLDKPERDE